MDWNFLIFSVVKIIGVFSVLMFIVAYAVWVERKVSAAIQDRRGPNRFGLREATGRDGFTPTGGHHDPPSWLLPWGHKPRSPVPMRTGWL